MPDATFACPDLTTFCRLDELGLEVTGQCLLPDRAVLACRITGDDSWCRRCGEQAAVRDSVTRELAHEPFGWRPTTLLVTVRRYRCAGCAHVWRHDISKAAEPRAKLSRRALQWALEALVCQHLSVARVAEGLAVSWNTANNAVLAEGRRLLIADPARFDGVAVIGVDEHVWRHTRRGDKYVTVIIDLTPVRDKTGPARLLDMVEGRSKRAFQNWLAERPQQWRDRVEVVAMDGFSGFKTASTEELPDAVTVMDPFHVVRLAGNALDECRRRVQLATCGHRGRKTDPLYRSRRTLHTGADLLTDKQKARLATLFSIDAHAEVEATWTIYQRTVAAYREPDRKTGRTMMAALITTLSAGVPKPLQEVIALGRTLKKRAVDVLAYFDRPGTSNADPPRRSTAAWNTYAAQPWDSATSPTTSPDRYWKPADSDPDYTVIYEEPGKTTSFTVADAVSWARLPRDADARWWAMRLGAVRTFATYLHAIGVDVQVPPRGMLPVRSGRSVTPYIYSQQDLTLLLQACPRVFTRELVTATMQTTIGLLAATGMRISEALRLRPEDIDTAVGVLTIRNSKNGLARLIPIHPSTADQLAAYQKSAARTAARPRTDGPLLVTTGGTGYDRDTVEAHFGKIVDAVGLQPHTRSRPRLHDLRHTFATAHIAAAYRCGADPQRTLTLLATWLGHTSAAHTYWYLSAAPELMLLATNRLENKETTS